MRAKGVLALVLVTGMAAGSAGAQTSVVSGATGTVSSTTVLISGSAYTLNGFPMYVQGKPFSLVEQVTTERMLQDGSKMHTSSEEHAYRDIEGRFRLEQGSTKTGQWVAMHVMIFDPVALTSVSFSPRGHTARLTKVAPHKPLTAEEEAKRAEAREHGEEFRKTHPGSGSEEKLGSQVIAGEYVDGVRRVTVFPATQDHGPLTTTSEKWISPELGLSLLEKTDSPFIGHMERLVTQLQRVAPDPALFKLPEGYTVQTVERPGPLGLP